MKLRLKNLPHHRSGFTLIEMLIVVAIIAALAFLVFSGARRARDSAMMTTGMTRIRSLQLANAGYASDHNGKFAPVWGTEGDAKTSYGDSWLNNPEYLSYLSSNSKVKDSKTGKYDENVLDPVVLKSGVSDRYRLSVSFGYVENNVPGRNWSSGGAPSQTEASKDPLRRWYMQTLHDPANMAAFITSCDFIGKYSGRHKWAANPKEGYQEGKVAYRYNGKMLAVFYDGHTEAVSYAKIKDIDANGGGVNNVFWGGKQH